MFELKEQNNYEITELILKCCFEVMNELGPGFLESVYKNALYIVMKENGLIVETEKKFDVIFRGKKIGLYKADLVVNNQVIVELKCCEKLVGEHQAQLINYLTTSGIMTGLLVNFGNRKVKYKRLYHPNHCLHSLLKLQEEPDNKID